MQPDTAAGYDALASVYADRLSRELDRKPFDRGFLHAFASELNRGELLDVGCGPGHIGASIVRSASSVIGLDLSAEMVREARARHPDLTFEVGDMRALPFANARFSGVLAFYSIIHLAADELPHAFSEMHRVLKPYGVIAIAFHVGNGMKRVEELWGMRTRLDFRFFEPSLVKACIENCGFDIVVDALRAPYGPEVEAQTARSYFLARVRSA